MNIYASCNRGEKQETWREITLRIAIGREFWCVTRDFNSTRNDVERQRKINNIFGLEKRKEGKIFFYMVIKIIGDSSPFPSSQFKHTISHSNHKIISISSMKIQGQFTYHCLEENLVGTNQTVY